MIISIINYEAVSKKCSSSFLLIEKKFNSAFVSRVPQMFAEHESLLMLTSDMHCCRP
jgi:hypothetical protein